MNINNAISLCRARMTEHGVGYLSFGFHSYPAEKAFTIGRCHFTHSGSLSLPHKITVSDSWIKVMEEDEVEHLIVHEIAHARVPYNPPGGNHGPLWEDECIRLGIIPKVKYKTRNVPDYVKAILESERVMA